MNYPNDVAISYARVITMRFEYIENQHPNDTSRMVEVDDISPMCPPFSMDSLIDYIHKGLKGQKEAKTIKNQQGTKETRKRVKKQPKIKAGSARHSKKGSQRIKLKSQGLKVTSFQSSKAIEKFGKFKGLNLQKRKVLYKRRRKPQGLIFKAYIILNKHTRKVKESLNVTFDETPPPSKTSPLVDDDLDEEEAIKVTEKKNLENDIMDETLEIDEIVNIKESRNHPLENVIGNLNQRTLRSQALTQSNFFYFISTIEPKNVNEALRGNPELENESYVLYDRIMTPFAAQLERKPRRDHGTRRGRHSTSSSSTFDQPSSSHLNDDDDDGNDEGTSRASTPSPIRYVNSLTNQVPQVFQNPPNIDPHLEPFYTRQTEIINRQVQLRDEQRGGVRSIGKSLRRLWRNMKK
ncbi:hypothetical protein Tco_1524941 [Tanacetum coccineum]